MDLITCHIVGKPITNSRFHLSGEPVIRPQPWNLASGGNGDAINCPTNQQIIVQNENVACAKIRRAAEPELNAPPARDVERSK